MGKKQQKYLTMHKEYDLIVGFLDWATESKCFGN